MKLSVILMALAIISAPSISEAGRSSISRQNHLADRYKLTRIRDLPQLKRFVGLGLLKPVGDSSEMKVDWQQVGVLDRPNARWYGYARPWVIDFLLVLAQAVNEQAGQKYAFRLTSLTRTKDYQRKLRRETPWAASGRSRERRSPHLTGAAVDVSLKDMPLAVRDILLRDLKGLMDDGAIDFLYERANNCLHIFVLPDWRKRTIYPASGR